MHRNPIVVDTITSTGFPGSRFPKERAEEADENLQLLFDRMLAETAREAKAPPWQQVAASRRPAIADTGIPIAARTSHGLLGRLDWSFLNREGG